MVGDGFDPGHVGRVRHQRHAAPALALGDPGHRRQALFCVPAHGDRGDIGCRNPSPRQIGEPGTCLGEAIAGLFAADGHDPRSDGLVVQHLRVVQAGFEDWRGLAVVLCGAEHNDRVSGSAVVHCACVDDTPARVHGQQDRGDNRQQHGHNQEPDEPGLLGCRGATTRAHRSAGHGLSGHVPKFDRQLRQTTSGLCTSRGHCGQHHRITRRLRTVPRPAPSLPVQR